MPDFVSFDDANFYIIQSLLERKRLSPQICRDGLRERNRDQLTRRFEQILDAVPVLAPGSPTQHPVFFLEVRDTTIEFRIGRAASLVLGRQDAAQFGAQDLGQQGFGVGCGEGFGVLIQQIFFLLLISGEQPFGPLHGFERKVGAKRKTQKQVWMLV